MATKHIAKTKKDEGNEDCNSHRSAGALRHLDSTRHSCGIIRSVYLPSVTFCLFVFQSLHHLFTWQPLRDFLCFPKAKDRGKDSGSSARLKKKIDLYHLITEDSVKIPHKSASIILQQHHSGFKFQMRCRYTAGEASSCL